MSLAIVDRDGIRPALAWLPQKMDSLEARVMLGAIGNQEGDGFTARRQYNNGPARSFWQMERGGGVVGVLTHHASSELALMACKWRGVTASSQSVWEAIEFDDLLAAIWARLLLYTDPRSLPALGNMDDAWSYYIRNWRPGKPHPDKWAENYTKAFNFYKDQ